MMRTFKSHAAGLKLGAAILLVSTLGFVPEARASKVTLKIRTGNPIEKPQKVPIHSALPAGISTNDIIALDGLDLGYDVKSGTYYVHKEIELGPKEIRIFNIEIKDIWMIPLSDIAQMRKRSSELVDKLKGKPDYGNAESLRQEVEKSFGTMERSQNEALLKPGEKITPHIKAYESNVGTLKRVREAIGRIENMVIDSGQDPGGELIGDVKGLTIPKHDAELPPEAYKTAVWRITVQNKSPTEARTNLTVRRELPAEIKLADIVDPGGLEAGMDSKTGVSYVFKEDVNLPPTQSVSFDVKILDKWNVHAPRIEAVLTNANSILIVVKTRGGFQSVEATLNGLIASLTAMKKEAGPAALNDQYVAFYRDQGERLDLIEQKVLRIESALRPKSKSTQIGIPGKPPTMKTTWTIIWGILIFLAFMSLLFFLRWYGKSGAEKLDDTTKGGT